MVAGQARQLSGEQAEPCLPAVTLWSVRGVESGEPKSKRGNMSPLRILFFILLVFATAGPVAAAHITDKLVVGIYPEPDAAGTPIKLLSSGEPLEVLQRKGGFSEVRMADDVRGWVENQYLTEEKPAKAMLLEAQTKLRLLNSELETLKANGAAADGTVAPAPVPAPSAREEKLRQEVETAATRIGELEKRLAKRPVAEAAQQQLETMRMQVHEALQILADAQGMELHAVGASDEEDFFTRYRTWIVGVAAVLLGFGLGVAFIDYRIRKRYGGLRI